MIRSIIEQLKNVSSDKAALKKYISQLQVFSLLRNLDEETTKIYRNMPLTINWEEHTLFKQGVEKGFHDRKLAITAMLKDNIPSEKIAEYLNIDIKYVLEIQEEIKKK